MTDQNAAIQAARPDSLARRALGHFWTVAPALTQEVYCPQGPESQWWQTTVENEFSDDVIYSGRYAEGESKRAAVVVLHGLGGTVDRGYCLAAADAAHRRGLSSLRLSLRGADGLGRDLYHAGFTDDLPELLSTPPLDEYDRIILVGYSLGGHVALNAAVDEVDDRLAAVVAICAPLDLKACQETIDARRTWVYRRYLLRGLKKVYPTIARGGRAPTPVERIEQVTTLREWDALTVVPRFGFDDVDHYYTTQSVGPRLGDLRIPTLFIASPGDPMVPADSLRGQLARAPGRMEVRWVRDGGHVFFPPDVELGLGDRPGVEHQAMAWAQRQVS